MADIVVGGGLLGLLLVVLVILAIIWLVRRA
jgi:hypothetical protein